MSFLEFTTTYVKTGEVRYGYECTLCNGERTIDISDFIHELTCKEYVTGSQLTGQSKLNTLGEIASVTFANIE